jgi:hypothetical protein
MARRPAVVRAQEVGAPTDARPFAVAQGDSEAAGAARCPYGAGGTSGPT